MAKRDALLAYRLDCRRVKHFLVQYPLFDSLTWLSAAKALEAFTQAQEVMGKELITLLSEFIYLTKQASTSRQDFKLQFVPPEARDSGHEHQIYLLRSLNIKAVFCHSKLAITRGSPKSPIKAAPPIFRPLMPPPSESDDAADDLNEDTDFILEKVRPESFDENAYIEDIIGEVKIQTLMHRSLTAWLSLMSFFELLAHADEDSPLAGTQPSRRVRLQAAKAMEKMVALVVMRKNVTTFLEQHRMFGSMIGFQRETRVTKNKCSFTLDTLIQVELQIRRHGRCPELYDLLLPPPCIKQPDKMEWLCWSKAVLHILMILSLYSAYFSSYTAIVTKGLSEDDVASKKVCELFAPYDRHTKAWVEIKDRLGMPMSDFKCSHSGVFFGPCRWWLLAHGFSNEREILTLFTELGPYQPNNITYDEAVPQTLNVVILGIVTIFKEIYTEV
jgi:hypothetical protein